MKTCHHCGRALELLTALQRTDSCPHCSSDLKCCLNCRFFDRGAANQCLEPQAEPVAEKEKANFCEFFDFRSGSAHGRPAAGGPGSDASDARSAFDALFRKK